jgi:riboflavin kinase/FMN adenylyltransferase
MHVFHSLAEIPAQFGVTVASIGNFDGVHRGHRAVLEQVKEGALARGVRSLAVTFDPHPARVLRPEGGPRLICGLEERIRLIAETGIDAVLVLPFTEELSQLRAAEFAKQILVDRLRVVEVHEGANFRFGYRAEGGVAELAALGVELGYAVRVHGGLEVHGIQVSSSGIRRLVAEGDVRRARWLLGRPFTLLGRPERGRGIGTRLTVPTINMTESRELLVPGKGVYVTRIEIERECFDAVTNVGDRPTFADASFASASFAVETHLLDFSPAERVENPLELTPDTPLRLTFLARIRDEVRWPSAEALKAQIGRDVGHARRYLRRLPRGG